MKNSVSVVCLVVLLAASAAFSQSPDDFGPILSVAPHEQTWEMAMMIQYLAPEMEPLQQSFKQVPLQYSQQLRTQQEDMLCLFKIAIDRGVCAFAEVFVPAPAAPNQFQMELNNLAYAPCDFDLKQVLLP